ncbi:MAG TPA: ATP-binding protein, partial [Sphingomicrobium sp.]|nr:ATP-binding protein [Sphingomicrobium sp.]
MLQQDLPSIDSEPLDRAGAWMVPAVAGAAALTVAALAAIAGFPLAALLIAGSAIVVAAVLWLRSGRSAVDLSAAVAGPDFSVVGATLGLTKDAAAITDADGSLMIANPAYRERFGGAHAPSRLASDAESAQRLAAVRQMAWRDGAGCVSLDAADGPVAIEVERIGARADLLLWRFPQTQREDPVALVAARIRGDAGEAMAAAGVLAAMVGPDGTVQTYNRPFASRALAGQPGEGVAYNDLIQADEDGQCRLAAEGEGARAMRAVYIPIDPPAPPGFGVYYLFDSPDTAPLSSSSHLQAMLDILPIGLALVDRDGRFLTMNDSFRAAAGIKSNMRPVYPGDLVAKEDKAAVADAVRRNARGPAMSGDIAVRLARNPKEPVALTIAGLRGLGDAVVLLLLKDNSEEAKLKRQVAQATKMQAVGQLAGGVAHDFNNILTAIIGHCDLMLMRHTPGDSDYDDIHQIKSNSNRAAGLTRQLLAFSRQQTLRPQVLQLTDVVAEVSHLLKRLLGETVKLVVKHGRDLGAVRADPGQLEQVIVNLAVNARDAMAASGGGTLTIQTYPVHAHQVAELGSDILPVADYSALSVTDTGCGIPANVLGKVFEPFFTTKEVGKGTGLGLSTVYGIVKQSGGFIFADSKVGQGTQFVIYLPVHQVDQDKGKARRTAKPKANELWGSGTVLLVEDEPMVRTVAERALARHGYSV